MGGKPRNRQTWKCYCTLEMLWQAAAKDEANYNTDLIPVHSYLMGGLVWAGVGGGLFWIVMSRWLLIEFIKNFRFLGFYFYNGIIELFWNIMFSPFGASARWSTVIFIAALYCYSRHLSKHGKPH